MTWWEANTSWWSYCNSSWYSPSWASMKKQPQSHTPPQNETTQQLPTHNSYHSTTPSRTHYRWPCRLGTDYPNRSHWRSGCRVRRGGNAVICSILLVWSSRIGVWGWTFRWLLYSVRVSRDAHRWGVKENRLPLYKHYPFKDYFIGYFYLP